MKLAFLGAGKMAAAIARGALTAGLSQPDELRASARSAASRAAFAAAVGVPEDYLTEDNHALVARCDALLLCVKPADAVAVLRDVAPSLRGQPVISVAAGVPLEDLQNAAGLGTPLVRAMPNTPALVAKGATAYALGRAAKESHATLAERIFGAFGDVHRVDEKLIDAVNGLSGSGPAYIFTVIEALADGGVLMGLPRSLAASLAVQTVLGAAEMVKQTGQHPAFLRESVASPGGTTMAAIEALEKGGLRAALIAAVRAATERAREMGRASK